MCRQNKLKIFMLLYLCPVINRTYKKESDMYVATLQKYKLKLSLMGHKYTPRDMDKPQSGIYEAIPLQNLLVNTKHDN